MWLLACHTSLSAFGCSLLRWICNFFQVTTTAWQFTSWAQRFGWCMPKRNRDLCWCFPTQLGLSWQAQAHGRSVAPSLWVFGLLALAFTASQSPPAVSPLSPRRGRPRRSCRKTGRTSRLQRQAPPGEGGRGIPRVRLPSARALGPPRRRREAGSERGCGSRGPARPAGGQRSGAGRARGRE